jgi:hypothetical protein
MKSICWPGYVFSSIIGAIVGFFFGINSLKRTENDPAIPVQADLLGFQLFGPSGESLGTVENFWRDDEGRIVCLQLAPTNQPEQEKKPSVEPHENTHIIQLKREQVVIQKKLVPNGGVRIRKVIHTEVVNQPVEIRREEIVIERILPNSETPH